MPAKAPCHKLRSPTGAAVASPHGPGHALGIFEFIVGLYAIIAGLGISLLVQSVGQLIEARQRVQLYWVHTVWIALIFVAHVSSWFAFWRFAGQATWSARETILVLLTPILLYLVSHLAVPDVDDDRVHDLRLYYYQQHRWMQGLMVAALAVTQLTHFAVLGATPLDAPDYVRMIVVGLLLPGVVSSAPRLHATQALLLLALLTTVMFFVAKPIG